MTEDERKNHAYLGDGLYGESTPFHIILRTGDHRDHFCDNRIYLEQSVLEDFLQWIAHLKHIEGQTVVSNLDLGKLFGILQKRCEPKGEKPDGL
jgi:hypothetical protein